VTWLWEQGARAATGAEEERARNRLGVHRRRLRVVDPVDVGTPAGLELVPARRVDAQAGAADRGRERIRGRVDRLRRRRVAQRHLVARVTGREVEADALGRRLHEHGVLLGDLRGRNVLAPVAVRVAHDVGGPMLDDVVDRLVDALVTVAGADVLNLGARSQAVHRLDVERLLGVPAFLAAALGLQPERLEHLFGGRRP